MVAVDDPAQRGELDEHIINDHTDQERQYDRSHDNSGLAVTLANQHRTYNHDGQ